MPKKTTNTTKKQAAAIQKEYMKWLKENPQYIKHELRNLPKEKREDRLKEIYGPNIPQGILRQFADELNETAGTGQPND